MAQHDETAQQGFAPDALRRVRIVWEGEVQGVGFRWTTHRIAVRAGLVGWVENEPDGTVVMEAQGTDEAIARLYAGVAERFRNFRMMPHVADSTELVPVSGEHEFSIRY